MRFTSWIDSLKTRLRRPGRTRRRLTAAPAVELLEDRTLLAVTSLVFGGDLTVISDADDAIVIREDPLNPGQVEILTGVPVGGTVTYTPDTSIGVLQADTVQTILVRGGDQDNDIDLGDRLGMGGVEVSVFTSLSGVTLKGGNGNDTITGTIDFADLIDGGHGEDVITVGTAGVTVDGGDGDDTITGGDGADVIDGGDGNDQIDGGLESDTIDGGDGHDVIVGGDELSPAGDAITGGQGHDTILGGDGDDWINGKSGDDRIDGQGGSDTIHGGAGSDVLDGGDADDTINGHGGNDTVHGNAGNDRINGHWGHDFLDGDDDTGTVFIGNDTILGGSGRDTLLGNIGDDNLKGQGGRDTLIGGPGLDRLNGGGSHDLLRAFQAQFVVLDFDSATDRGYEYDYTPGQRASIEARMASDFAAFDLQFSQEVPLAKDLYLQNGAYVTIAFNEEPSGTGIALAGAGEASEFDFRNMNLGGRASVDVLGPNGLLGGVGQPAPTNDNVIAASSWVAAHELGHLLGLRHVDAFGPLNAITGITDPPGPNAFSPIFPGPSNATETDMHIMTAPSLLGAGVLDVTADRFLGERAAIKLAFNETGLFVQEQSTPHNSLTPAGSQPINLRNLGVPNTLETGANAQQSLNVEAAAVIGASISTAGEFDVYSFEGTGGQVVSIEIFSEWLDRIAAPIDTILRVYDSTGQPLPYFTSDTATTDIAVSDGFDDGSGQATIDPILINLTLPITGNPTDTYYVEVSEPRVRGVFALPTDGSDQIVELDPVTGIELNRFDLPGGATSTGMAALAYDGVNDLLYFMNGGQDTLFELDPDDGTVLDSDQVISPIVSSPGDYDGLAIFNSLVYILDVTAENIPGQVADPNANPAIPQILDPPEILIFDPVADAVVNFLNLVGTGEGTIPASNPPATFVNITGGLASILNGGASRLLLLDQAGTVVHEIDPTPGPTGGASMINYSPTGVEAGNYAAVGAHGGRVYLGSAGGGSNVVEIYDRVGVNVTQTLSLTPNPPPAYNLTAFGADDNVPAATGVGDYELFITKVDFSPATVSLAAGDTLIGGSGDDTMWGGSANDVIKGGAGNDTGSGLGGNDYINAGGGNDTLYGGLDNDSMLGGAGSDKLYGDAGNDTIDGQGATDTLDGGAGNDLLRWRVGNGSDVMNNSAGSARVEVIGNATADSMTVGRTTGNRPKLTVSDGTNTIRISKTIWRIDINAGDGADMLTVGTLTDVGGALLSVNGEDGDDVISAAGSRIDAIMLRLDGGDGDDTLTGSLDDDTLWGGAGNDRADGGRGDDTLLGGDGDDDLEGSDGDDVALGGNGNDSLSGGNGHDNLYGEAGFDTLTGGFGRDTLSGGDDDDALSGNQDDDSLTGDAGRDSLYGGTGDDYLHGGLNDDSLYGNYGDDTIGGGHGHDLLEGSNGDDILNGGDGDDTMNGGEGYDGLSGHDGNDLINGGGQDDTIIGGDGNDQLLGGSGRDILLGGDGNDTLGGQGAFDTLAGNEGTDVLVGLPAEINENFTFYESWVDAV